MLLNAHSYYRHCYQKTIALYALFYDVFHEGIVNRFLTNSRYVICFSALVNCIMQIRAILTGSVLGHWIIVLLKR